MKNLLSAVLGKIITVLKRIASWIKENQLKIFGTIVVIILLLSIVIISKLIKLEKAVFRVAIVANYASQYAYEASSLEIPDMDSVNDGISDIEYGLDNVSDKIDSLEWTVRSRCSY